MIKEEGSFIIPLICEYFKYFADLPQKKISNEKKGKEVATSWFACKSPEKVAFCEIVTSFNA